MRRKKLNSYSVTACFIFVCFLFAVLVFANPACSCDPELVPIPLCIDGDIRECYNECPGHGESICKDGEWGSCEDMPQPSVEICDGVDNDCDGFVDNGLRDNRLGVPCGEACYTGRTSCSGGKVVCVGDIPPEQEVCNGIDDDCNGVIDDVPERICYTGPEGTQGVGICHGGIYICKNGRGKCEFEQIPEPFACGDGLDHDCDGVVDGLNTVEPVDVLLAIDMSCSMMDDQITINRALSDFILTDIGAAPDKDNIHFGLLAVPGTPTGSQCILYSDFVTPDEFVSKLGLITYLNSGDEPTLDCVLGAVHPDNPFGLSYRDGVRRVIILMTDEYCGSPWCNTGCGSSCGQWSDFVSNWPYSSSDPRSNRLNGAEVAKYIAPSGAEVIIITWMSLYNYYSNLGGLVIPAFNLGQEAIQDSLRSTLISISCK